MKSNATMRVPGKVVAGPQSSAIVAVGSRCEIRVGARETVEIRGNATQLCVARLDGAPNALAGEVPPALVGVLLGGGLAGAIAAAINDPDRGVSR